MTGLELLIQRFVAVWDDPPGPHKALYLAEVRRALGGYRPEVLDRLGDIAIDTRVTWPRPAELRAIALKAAAILAIPIPEMQPVRRRTDDEKARAEQMMAEFRRTMTEPRDTRPCPTRPAPLPVPTTLAARSVPASSQTVVAFRRPVT